MAEYPIVAIGVDLAVETITRIAPRGLAWARTRVAGRRILIVGHKRAGKSCLADYLQYGILRPEGRSRRTFDVEYSSCFEVGVGTSSRLQLHVSKLTEIPGQYDVDISARLARKHRPDAVVVVINLMEHASLTWAKEFINAWNTELTLPEGSMARRRLKAVVVALSHLDKAKKKQVTASVQKVRRFLRSQLSAVLRRHHETLPIIPCCLVESNLGSRTAQQIVISLARDLARTNTDE